MPEPDIISINQILEGIWHEAAMAYAAEYRARELGGRKKPVGVQRYLNATAEDRFGEASWSPYGGTYFKDGIWLRITYRHQMSLGSNIIDALKAVGKYNFQVAIIAAATESFLDLISPADARALTSFEKLLAEVNDLAGVVSAPIIVGELGPYSRLGGSTAGVIHSRERVRR